MPIYSWRETVRLFICNCLTRTTAIQMEYKAPSALPAVLRHLANNTDGYQLVEWGGCKHVRVLIVLFVCSVVFFIFEILNFKVESNNKVVFYLSLKYHY